VRVLVEEVMLGHPGVFEPGLVGCLHHLDVVHQRVMLGIGIDITPELRCVALDEKTKLHETSSP